MKLVVYTGFLGLTSLLLNICVRYHFWIFAKPIIEFRKRHIAITMRRELFKA